MLTNEAHGDIGVLTHAPVLPCPARLAALNGAMQIVRAMAGKACVAEADRSKRMRIASPDDREIPTCRGSLVRTIRAALPPYHAGVEPLDRVELAAWPIQPPAPE